MVFTLGTLFEAALLLVNAVAILNEERFLKKGRRKSVINYIFIIIFISSVGWGRDYRNEGFVDQGGIKYQLVSLVTSVQTLLRGEDNEHI